MSNLPLDVVLRELRARAHEGDEQVVVLYGRPLPEHRHLTTTELIADARRLQQAMYLVDMRRDLDAFGEEPAVARAAAAVTMLVEASALPAADGGWTLKTARFGTRYGLCNDERFVDQPCAGFCSGVLVAPRVVATAAHCIAGVRPEARERRLAEIRCVFGFRSVLLDGGAVVLAARQVYTPTRLLGHVLEDGPGADWALFELDRDVEAEPMAVRREGTVAAGAELAVIGHPLGLPAKYAPGAHVRANEHASFFRADVDAFGGNSGSPVFGSDWTVEGLLVRGAPDFVRDGSCRKSLVIPIRDEADDPPGEDCVRATLFARHLS